MTLDTIIPELIKYCRTNQTRISMMDFGEGKQFPYTETQNSGNWRRQGGEDKRINTTTYRYICDIADPYQKLLLDYDLQAEVLVDKTGRIHDITLERKAKE